MAQTKKQAKSAKDQEATVLKVVGGFKSSWDYVSSNYHDTWENCWKLYNNIRVKRGYEGITNTFVPMTFSTVETMVAALASGRPKFNFAATEDVQIDTDTKLLNDLLNYYWDCDMWQTKIEQWMRSMLIYGTGVLYLYWDIDKPRMINVPLRDFFVDPTASRIENAAFAGRRYLTMKENLEEMQIVNFETEELEPRYMNLSKIGERSGADDTTDREEKDMLIGSVVSGEEAKKQIEVIEYWTEDRCYSVANRSVLIEDRPNPYKSMAAMREEEYPKGLLPFVIQNDYADESLFFGKGEVEPVADSQELLNDLTNQNTDAITFALNPMFTVEEKHADKVDQVESLPGAVYPFEVLPVPLPSIPNDAFNERLNIKNEMREVTAADEVVKGVRNDTAQTATEVTAQIAQAGQRFQVKVMNIENYGFQRLAKLVWRMIKLYVDKPMSFPDSKGNIAEYDPVEYVGDFEPKVQLDISIQKDKEAEKRRFNEMYGTMVGNPLINQEELTKMQLEKAYDLEPDEAEKLMQQPQMGMGDPMMDPMADPMAGMTGDGLQQTL